IAHISVSKKISDVLLPQNVTILEMSIQPFTLFNLIYPWLTVFPIPQLTVGFSKLQSIIYYFTDSISLFLTHPDLYFSSA
ncbi:hypothetical protein QUA80_10160, partial [Microcoleus sp. F4-D5]